MTVHRGMMSRVLRAACACVMLWTCLCAWPSRLARERLEQIPDMNFAHESRQLREQGRLGEAGLVVRAGLSRRGADHHALREESRLLAEAESSWTRRTRDAVLGAVSGKGESVSALVGSMTGDLLLLGDARDLVIEAGRSATSADTDEVMVALSALGVGTTAAPYADWVPSLLKWARRRGALSDALAMECVGLVRERSVLRSAALLWDVGTLARRASPGGMATILSSADSINDVHRLARCAVHHEHGAFALLALGDEGRAVLLDAPRDGDAAALERTLVAASFKGQAGARFLRMPEGRALRTPHPLARGMAHLGLIRPARLVARVIESLDTFLILLIPALGVWVVIECVVGGRAVANRGAPEPEKRA